MYNIYEEMVNETNAEDFKLIARLYSIGNGLKVFEGTYKGLLDPFLVARKKDFEKNFKAAVNGNGELKEKYGMIWDEIEQSRAEARKDAKKIFAYTLSNLYTPQYFFIAKNLIEYSRKLKNGEINRDVFDTLTAKVFPADLDKELQHKLLSVQLKIYQRYLPENSELIKKFLNGKSGNDAVEDLILRSSLISKEKTTQLAESGADAILNSDDPFIYFILNTQDDLKRMMEESKARVDNEVIANQMLGEALYKVYGDAIPPDATGTLRLADGIVKGYDYNGTRAPIKTTFYGALDRYYSFDKKFPFNLPSYFENLPDEFDPSTPLNFISTNDIIGGNSGSAVINKNAEIVGLAFDGNIESLPSNFIYTTEANRTVCVSALGMMEAIRDLYKAARLSNELAKGKME
jgi:hypothetical protein